MEAQTQKQFKQIIINIDNDKNHFIMIDENITALEYTNVATHIFIDQVKKLKMFCIKEVKNKEFEEYLLKVLIELQEFIK